jgi:hypothetical protein
VEYEAWRKRDLSGEQFVSIWADGIHMHSKGAPWYRLGRPSLVRFQAPNDTRSRLVQRSSDDREILSRRQNSPNVPVQPRNRTSRSRHSARHCELNRLAIAVLLNRNPGPRPENQPAYAGGQEWYRLALTLQGLHKPGAFPGGGDPLAVESTGVLENAVKAGGADRHDVVAEHHEGQSAVSFERTAVVELQDGLLLPRFEPVIPGDLVVVLIGLAIPVFPSMEFAGSEIEPTQDVLSRSFSPIGPVADVIEHLVAGVMGSPTCIQDCTSGFLT